MDACQYDSRTNQWKVTLIATDGWEVHMKMFCDLKVFMRAESGRSLEEIQIFVELWYNCGIVAAGTPGISSTAAGSSGMTRF